MEIKQDTRRSHLFAFAATTVRRTISKASIVAVYYPWKETFVISPMKIVYCRHRPRCSRGSNSISKVESH